VLASRDQLFDVIEPKFPRDLRQDQAFSRASKWQTRRSRAIWRWVVTVISS
jgi:hypothetical protein